MFIFSWPLKVSLGLATVVGGSTTVMSIHYKEQIKEFFEYKYETLLVSPHEQLNIDVSSYDFSKPTEIDKKLKEQDKQLSESIKEKNKASKKLFNDKTKTKNYKCMIPSLTGKSVNFDVNCEIFKIKSDVKKTSEILNNKDLLESTDDINYYEYYVLKVSKNLFSNYDWSKKLPIHIIDANGNTPNDTNTFVSLNVFYKFDDDTKTWQVASNIFLVSYIWKRTPEKPVGISPVPAVDGSVLIPVTPPIPSLSSVNAAATAVQLPISPGSTVMAPTPPPMATASGLTDPTTTVVATAAQIAQLTEDVKKQDVNKKLMYDFPSELKGDNADQTNIDFKNLTVKDGAEHINHKSLLVIRGLNPFTQQETNVWYVRKIGADESKTELLKFLFEKTLIGFLNHEPEKQKFYILDK